MSTMSTVNVENRLSKEARELALLNYNHVEQQATLAATKSALLVAAHALLAAAYVAVAKDWNVFKAPGPHVWLYVAAGFMITLAFVLSLWAIVPKSKVEDPSDLLFFASVAQRASAEAYLREYREATDSQLERMLLRTTYGKSLWLRKNFRSVRLAVLSSCIGTLCAIAGIIVLAGGS